MMAERWQVETVSAVVDEEIEALPGDMRGRLARIVDMIEQHGLQNVGMPYVRHLADKLWEIRVKGRGGISRVLYMTATGRRVILLRAFVKKTQKTPRKEIELALRRAEEIQ